RPPRVGRFDPVERGARGSRVDGRDRRAQAGADPRPRPHRARDRAAVRRAGPRPAPAADHDPAARGPARLHPRGAAGDDEGPPAARGHHGGAQADRRRSAARRGARRGSRAMSEVVRAPHGTTLRCKGWPQEAALRMLMNNLDPEVAERPADLVVYGGTGKAARNWECFDAIVRELERLGSDETPLVQSGRGGGVLRTQEDAPRVLIANSNPVPHWATWDKFWELEKAGLMMYGQMTAGSWIYIGTQGILQGTYETFASAARVHFDGTLAGRL